MCVYGWEVSVRGTMKIILKPKAKNDSLSQYFPCWENIGYPLEFGVIKFGTFAAKDKNAYIEFLL